MNNTTRFSDRVQNYVKYRPSYPRAVYELLQAECGLSADSTIADIGSGTGISSELFLREGNIVYGVEPNGPMREAAEQLLGDYASFMSVNGSAEATTLADASADFIVAGTAFHWFDRDKTGAEFRRLLRPNGWVVLMWNERNQHDPLQYDYDQLLQQMALKYNEVGHRNVTSDKVAPFFSGSFQHHNIPNEQFFDLAGMQGRALSSSYTPNPSQPNHEAFMQAVEAIFNRYQQNGRVRFAYITRVYFGQAV